MLRYVLEHAGVVREVEVERTGEGLFVVTVDGVSTEVDARLVEESVISMIADGICREVHFTRERGAYTLLIGGEHYVVSARNRRVRAAFALGEVASVGRQVMTAPMPARVAQVTVRSGDSVKTGDILVVLEAMKMENPLRSPVDGVVDEVSVLEGQVVSAGQKLLVVG